MKRENRDNFERGEKRKIISVIGFLIAITLLSVAIIISINQSDNTNLGKIKINNITKEGDSTETSMSLGKSINEVINKAEEVNKTEETKSTSSSLETNNLNTSIAETEQNTTNDPINENSKNIVNQNNSSINENNKNSVNQNNFIMPVDGKIVKAFSMNELIYSETLQEWTTHRGIDIQAEKTTVVKAVADGTVKSIKQDPRYGLSIIIEHDGGFTSIYSCLLSSEFIKEGEKVKQGESIGTIGNSGVFESADGSHLHLEIMKNGEYVNPEIYIK